MGVEIVAAVDSSSIWDIAKIAFNVILGVLLASLLGLLGIAWRTKYDTDDANKRFGEVEDKFTELEGDMKLQSANFKLEIAQSQQRGEDYTRGAISAFISADLDNDMLRLKPIEGELAHLNKGQEDIKRSIEAIFRRLNGEKQ